MQENKQLTPEEIAIQEAKRAMPSYYSEPFKPHSWVVSAITLYAKQQTTAKDEEIKQLKADREKYATQKVKDACNDRDEIMRQLYKNEMAAKDERIKELEGIYQSEKNLREQAERIYNTEHARIAELENDKAELNANIEKHELTIRNSLQVILDREREEVQALAMLEKARSVISSLKLSMLVHPDNIEGSEFDDCTSKAQDIEDEIEKFSLRICSGKNETSTYPSFDEFWKDIVCNPDGTLNEDQVKKELHDFFYLMEEVPKVYCHITNGALSYITYPAETVIRFADDCLNNALEEAERDWKTEQNQTWVSVDEQLPVVGERYNFINDIPHSPYYGEVFGGKYMGLNFGCHEFALPGYSMTAKLYCPILPVPESEADKA